MHAHLLHVRRAAIGALLSTLAACSDPTIAAPPEVVARRMLSSTTIVVTNANDAGVGSLRESIAVASDGDVITFNPSLSGATIVLASPLSVVRGLVIEAPAGGITLNANGGVRVVDYDATSTASASTASLIMKRITLTGSSNGGIWARGGSIRLENCIVEANRGTSFGGILITQGGTLSLLHTVVRSNNSTDVGGGVLVESGTSATITNSTVSNNSARLGGGGIMARGNVTLIASTVSGNSASSGGGVASEFAAVVVRNSTLSENTATGHDGNRPLGSNILSGWTLEIEHSTIVGNSSAPSIDPGQSGIVIRNSILISPVSVCGLGFSIELEGANLMSDNSCSVLFGAPAIIADAKLAPLAVDGLTAVHRLLHNSPAINAAPTCPVSVDQRGAPRPQGPACDLGSIEEAIRLVVTPTTSASGTINSKTGVVLINGRVTCSVDGPVSFNATLEQAQKSGKVSFVLKASTPVQATCVSGAALWSAFTVPVSGAFANGTATVKLAVSGAGVVPFNSGTAIRLNWAK